MNRMVIFCTMVRQPIGRRMNQTRCMRSKPAPAGGRRNLNDRKHVYFIKNSTKESLGMKIDVDLPRIKATVFYETIKTYIRSYKEPNRKNGGAARDKPNERL